MEMWFYLRQALPKLEEWFAVSVVVSGVVSGGECCEVLISRAQTTLVVRLGGGTRQSR